MDKVYWKQKMKIPKEADVAYYQNPKFFRGNSFRKEPLEKSVDAIIKETGKVNIYTITGIANKRHKHNGQRMKICLVREFL